jgi:hypothetical protein
VGRFKGLLHDAGKATPGRKPREAKPAPAEPAAPKAEGSRGRGRPKGTGKGKRSSKAHKLAGAYLKRKTHADVMRALFDDDSRDFSDLVEELLSEWLKSRK